MFRLIPSGTRSETYFALVEEKHGRVGVPLEGATVIDTGRRWQEQLCCRDHGE